YGLNLYVSFIIYYFIWLIIYKYINNFRLYLYYYYYCCYYYYIYDFNLELLREELNDKKIIDT
ncbi:hypothetical protein ACMBCM_08060, partial [Spiroplasma sp. K1]